MSLYILVLSAMPCTDTVAMVESEPDRVEFIENYPNEHHSDTEEHCSPFCACSCCHIAVMLNYSVYSFSETLVHTPKIYISRSPSFISNYYVNIWQSPQLG